MDFTLTEEQVLLRESVVKYVSDHGGVERHRKLANTEMGFEPQAWLSFAELGWLALPISEEDGGLGGTTTDLMVLCEAMGRGLVREPYLHTVVSCGGLLSAGANAQQRADYLQPLSAGESQWAFAFAEQSSGYSFTAIETCATATGDAFSISGSKIAVLNGNAADHFIVTANIDSALTLFIIDADHSGVTIEPFTAVDGSRGAVLRLEDVAVSADAVLGDPGEALPLINQMLDCAVIAIAAESVGAMQVLLDVTVEYAKTREQFGKPIGTFQALQHRMADMYLKLEETRSLLFNAAIALEQGSDDASAACAGLKVKLGEAGRFISHEAVQIHGGIGMTDELIVGHLFKRLLLLAKLYGDDEYYLQRYSELRAA